MSDRVWWFARSLALLSAIICLFLHMKWSRVDRLLEGFP
jgi:hypothetical protein